MIAPACRVRYFRGVTALPELSHHQPALVLIYEPPEPLLPVLIAHLSLHQGMWVLDAGNCFPAYAIARHVRRLTPDLGAALARIQVRRAFTCYQVLAALEQFSVEAGALLVLDLLASFYDQSVPLGERQRLLVRSVAHLKRLSRQVPLGVIIFTRGGQPETRLWLKIVERAADEVWRFSCQQPASPLRLF